jgi:hypothetical protein
MRDRPERERPERERPPWVVDMQPVVISKKVIDRLPEISMDALALYVLLVRFVVDDFPVPADADLAVRAGWTERKLKTTMNKLKRAGLVTEEGNTTLTVWD